jgi:glycosyltransferase involved in cell wall biosynthesis
MNKISVIMPVTLGLYHGCALNRVEKFNRAVNSFINQNYKNKELIIISDGCDIAEDIYVKNFNNYNNILFEKQEKATAFSGSVRNKGISLATGDWICYLDSDDFFGDKHLELLASQITNELENNQNNDKKYTVALTVHDVYASFASFFFKSSSIL